MNTKERILSIRLTERITKRPDYAKTIGITIVNNRTGKEEKNSKKQFKDL